MVKPAACRRQDTAAAAEPRAKISRGGLAWALVAIVAQHLWLDARGPTWRDNVQVMAMDGFTGFKTATTEELPEAVSMMDPFHVVRLAEEAMDGLPSHGCGAGHRPDPAAGCSPLRPRRRGGGGDRSPGWAGASRGGRVIALLARAQEESARVTIPATALAQAVRNPARQARLARLVRQPKTDVVALDRVDATGVGRILAASGTGESAHHVPTPLGVMPSHTGRRERKSPLTLRRYADQGPCCSGGRYWV